MSTTTQGRRATFDVASVRKDFPILMTTVRGRPLVYLDSAATTQKPRAVIDAVRDYYETSNANIHRGLHHLSEKATAAYERTRGTVQRFLNAASPDEIVFVRGATEGINLVARSFARPRLKEGDAILLTHMEHHSNIVPWQLLREETGAKLLVAPIDDDGVLDIEAFERLLGSAPVRIVALAHVSNALGTINPVKRLAELAHAKGAFVLVDGAQAVPHMGIDVRDLDADFYVFSGHKAYGPTGVGALYGKREHLESMPPWQGGGEMIRSVTFEKTTFNKVPHRFEAGTPNIAGVICMGTALDYLDGIGLEAVARYELELLTHANAALGTVKGLKIIGTAREKAGVISFTMEGAHPHDIGTILDQQGIAIRAGHHCAQPLMDRFGIPATARASFGIYTTLGEIDALVDGLKKVSEIFGS